jgi:tRNA/tmRNA/rRNA uracil-C5-methylase (TrmA/RlmC/RlmD family)
VIDAIVHNRRLGFRTAQATKISTPSEHRIPVACLYYESCGGCNFLHIYYHEQLNLKRKIVQKAFDKYKIPYHIPLPIESPIKTHYRNKATFTVKYKNSNIISGFHPFWEKSIIDIEHCLILKAEINHLNQIVKNSLAKVNGPILNYTIRTNGNNESILILKIQSDQISFTHDYKELTPFFTGIYITTDEHFYTIEQQKDFYETAFGQELKLHPVAFFQNHSAVAEQIVNYIKQNINFENKTIYDLYCGIGYFSLLLNTDNKHKAIIGIDNNHQAIKDAQFNATKLSIENCEFVEGDVLKTFTNSFLKQNPLPEIIILDPPRSGTLIEILKTMVNAKAEHIVYFACNPVSLAWNLTYLLPYYEIVDVQLFDMFPQTHQVETVAILKRIT